MSLRIVTVRLGHLPQVERIKQGFEAMRDVVGGEIHVVRRRPEFPPEIYLICNEKGMVGGLPPNGCGILGPYFFVRAAPSLTGFVDVTDDDVAAIENFWRAHRGQSHPSAYGGPTIAFRSMQETTIHIHLLLIASLQRKLDAYRQAASEAGVLRRVAGVPAEVRSAAYERFRTAAQAFADSLQVAAARMPEHVRALDQKPSAADRADQDVEDCATPRPPGSLRAPL
jgi:hypothetical protein